MYTFDHSWLPLQIIRIAGAFEDADVDAMEACMRDVLRTSAPFVTLTLARTAERPSSAVRKRIAELTAQTHDANALAVAIVVSNPIVAGAVTAIRWIAPSPRPEKTFTAAGEAIDWLQTHASKKGITISDAARRHAIALDLQR